MLALVALDVLMLFSCVHVIFCMLCFYCTDPITTTTAPKERVSQCDSDSLLADSSYLTDNILSPEDLPPPGRMKISINNI